MNPTNSIDEIHHTDKKIEQLINSIKKSKLSQKNQKALLQYHEKNKTLAKLSQHTCLAFAFRFLKEVNKDLNQITKKDVKEWWNKKLDRLIRKEIKPAHLKKTCTQTRKFLRIHFGFRHGRFPAIAEEIEWDRNIKINGFFSESKLPTQQKVKELIETAYNQGSKMDLRNQALFSLCNDVGCRIGEALSMNLSDVQEQENYLVITLPESKTLPREVISYMAKPFLKKWLSVHQPKKVVNGRQVIDYSKPLFIDRSGKRMSYQSARMVLNRLLNRTGISLPERKKTHVFRHLFSSRAKWSADVKDYWLGWTGRMSNRYTHLSYKDTIEPYFRMLKEENNPMMPIECECGHLNSNIDFCEKCGLELKVLNVLNNTPERSNKLIKEIFESQNNELMFKVLDEWWDKKRKK